LFLSAGALQLKKTSNVVIVGDLKEDDTQEMVKSLRKHYLPTTVTTLKHPDKAGLGYQQIAGQATAYVCRDQTCLPPTTNLAVMLEQLELKQEKR